MYMYSAPLDIMHENCNWDYCKHAIPNVRTCSGHTIPEQQNEYCAALNVLYELQQCDYMTYTQPNMRSPIYALFASIITEKSLDVPAVKIPFALCLILLA